MTYSVTLHDFPGIPDDTKHAAEARYQRALDKALGADVLPAYQAWQSVSETANEQLDPEDVALARRWEKASDSARQAGFRDLGDANEAFFDVKPAR